MGHHECYCYNAGTGKKVSWSLPYGLQAGHRRETETGRIELPGPCFRPNADRGYMFAMMAFPNSEHLTSLAPSIKRAKSYVTVLEAMAPVIPERSRLAASSHPR